MDKVVSIKRKAQRFVQAGDLAKAVTEYERLIETGQVEPYDYLAVGDLLTRLKRMDDAVLRYRDAIQAYERVGLYKNAVAVCKKLIRVRPDAFDILKLLGGLYTLEGLQTDAIFYYLQFMAAAPPDRETESIREVGKTLLLMPLPSADVALKIVDIMDKAGCAQDGARALYDLGINYEERGMREWGATVKARAAQLNPDVDQLEPTVRLAHRLVAPPATPAAEPDALDAFVPSAEEAAFAPPLSVDFARPTAPAADDATAADGGVSAVHEIGDAIDEPAATTAPSRTSDPGLDFGMIDIGAAGAAAMAATRVDVDDTTFSAEFVPGDPTELVAAAEAKLEEGDTPAALVLWLAAARSAFNMRQSRRAEEIYLEIVARDPNHLEALQGLTEIAHINGERQKIVRFGCELGDVLLARELYGEAKLEFERVLQFDPKNEKARARVSRLNSIEGIDKVTARPLAPVASEVTGAMVTVRGEQVQTQTVNDLSEILVEFEKAMAAQVSDDDAQSHYDLGMTYLEMGMHDQAIASFTAASAAGTHRSRAMEMLARCHIEAGNPETAIETVDSALADGVEDTEREAALYTWRGLALEQIGYAREAVDELKRALELDPGLAPAIDAVRRLNARLADGAAA